MNSRLRIVIFGLLLFTTLAGCVTVPEGDGVTVSLYPHESTNSEESILDPITVTNDSFELDGYLNAGAGAPDRDVYRDVTVRVYNSDKELICIRSVGDWAPTETPNVSIQLDSVPNYVIVYSRDFWDSPNEVKYYVYSSETNGFDSKRAYEKDDLPVEISNKSGEEC